MKKIINQIKKEDVEKYTKVIVCVLIGAGFFYRVMVLFGSYSHLTDASRGILGKHSMLVLIAILYFLVRKKQEPAMNAIMLGSIGIGIANVLSWCGIKTCMVLIPMALVVLWDIVKGTLKFEDSWVIIFVALCVIEIYSIIMIAYYYIPQNAINFFLCSKWSDGLLFIAIAVRVLFWKEDGTVIFCKRKKERSADIKNIQ